MLERLYRFFPYALMSVALVLMVGCGSIQGERDYPKTERQKQREKIGSVTGDEGIVLFGGRREQNQQAGAATGIGVNAFLWRAALDTVSFMPLTAVDPFGGTIITDWYAPPETPQERFKANVFIQDQQLRSDAVRVSIFRQERVGAGEWRDATVPATTARDMENAILARARQLRINSGS